MKAERNMAVFLSLVFLSLGISLLRNAILDVGTHSNWDVLLGGGLTALGLVAVAWAVERHVFTTRLERHVRGTIRSRHR
jgi:hypothetical protein